MLIFGPLMNITGSILASYWLRKPPIEKEEREQVMQPAVVKN